MNNLKLSIIIPAYNSEKFIEKCLYSCLHQDISHDDYEIIVVDDGSTDNTRNIVLSMKEKYNNIIYIYQENAAQGAARNNGLSKAKGKYIWFVDSDDWIAEYCLGTIIERLEKDMLTAILVGHATKYSTELSKWENFDDKKICTGKELINKNKFYISPTYAIWEKFYLTTNNIKFIERIFHEDSEICPKIYYNAPQIGFMNKVCYFVYPNLDSTTRKINPKRAFDLIRVIDSISQFNQEITEKNIKKSIYNYTSLLINASLYNSYSLSKKEKKSLNKAWCKNKTLFNNLIKSNKPKYKIEGILFKLFPSNICSIYQLIQLLNLNPGNMNKQNKLLGK